MSFPKILFLGAIAVFAIIGGLALYKKRGVSKEVTPPKKEHVQKEAVQAPPVKEKRVAAPQKPLPADNTVQDFPTIDRVFQLFTLGPTKLPIVETVTYASSVPWLKGRPAWLADYATHYATSRHFIARGLNSGLNGTTDYLSQKVSPGNRFNVFRKDKHINFYLLVDLSRCKMGFYYLDLDTKERVLLKTYRVGVGRPDPQSLSGSLTPLGTYSLGSKIAIYKPGTAGFFRDQKVEMVSVFGTRWIPIHEAVEGSTSFAKGYGIHGAPWTLDSKAGQFVENREIIGKCESDGSILLSAEDVEELFAIIITKPSYMMVVKDFREARMPGIEVATPTR
ncbi:MAG: L,D-transpeptidase [Chlamydiales bacterium]|nr:L,D-transpeptidase [Chlamydiales bacterium]